MNVHGLPSLPCPRCGGRALLQPAGDSGAPPTLRCSLGHVVVVNDAARAYGARTGQLFVLAVAVMAWGATASTFDWREPVMAFGGGVFFWAALRVHWQRRVLLASRR